MKFKDLFSAQAADYAKFRPTYPKELFKYLSSVVESHELCWDCGTGNGQAAIELASNFNLVIATDPSPGQLKNAAEHSRVQYFQASASSAPMILDRSVDLVTAAQAFHWFKQDEFFREVSRVVKPGGVLAFWCYSLAKISPEVNAVVDKLYEGILGPYWEKERLLVEEHFKNVVVPFEEIKAPHMTMSASWTFNHLVGYLSTWSALQKYIQVNSSNPIELVFEDLKQAWGGVSEREVHWDLGIRVSRV